VQTWIAIGVGAVAGGGLAHLGRLRDQHATLIMIALLAGSAIASVFAPAGLRGGYGLGLAGGFFGYALGLGVVVLASRRLDVDFLLDGRRRGRQRRGL